MNINNQQITNITNAVDGLINALTNLNDQLKSMVQEEKPVLNLISTKPVKAKSRHDRLGDAGFENSVNPMRQKIGQIGGLKGAGIKHTSTSRRQYGTVNFKDMTIAQKRVYWRWADARRSCRKQNITPPTWNEWVQLDTPKTV